MFCVCIKPRETQQFRYSSLLGHLGKEASGVWQSSYSGYKVHVLFSSALAFHVLLWNSSKKDSVWLKGLLPPDTCLLNTNTRGGFGEVHKRSGRLRDEYEMELKKKTLELKKG